MKQKIHYLFMLLLMLLTGVGGVKAQEILTEGFEKKEPGTNYQRTVTVSSNESDCGIGWEIYYGTVSTSSKIAGNNSAALRLYTSSNYGYIKSTTPVEGLSKVNFKAKAATSNGAKIKINVSYSTDGDSWISLVTDRELTSSAVDYSYDIPSGGKFFQIAISSNSKKPSSSSAQLTIDDVVFTYSDLGKENVKLSFGEISSQTVGVGKSVKIEATATPSVLISYSSSDETIATVSTDGTVTGKKTGTTTIKASFAGNDQYNSASDEYELTVIPSELGGDVTEETIIINEPYGNSGNNAIILYDKGKNGQNGPLYYNNSELRLYCDNTLTVSSESKKIAKIEFDFVVNKNSSGVIPESITYTSGSCEEFNVLSTSLTSAIWNAPTNGVSEVTFTINGSAGNVGFKSAKVYYVLKSFDVAPASNNESYGTVSFEEGVITATPAEGYRVSLTNPYEVTPAGAATVVQDGNDFTVTATADCTVQINFEAIPTHTATFSVNGTETSMSFAEGSPITFNTPDDVQGKKFVGWTTATIDGTTDECPELVTLGTMGNADVKYYAVFANVTAGSAISTEDKLTLATTGVSGNEYGKWSGKKATSDAVYAGLSAGDNNSIQLRSKESNSGVISTTSGGKLKKVVVVWNGETANGRTLNVYGSNTAYTAATELYGDNAGTLLGTIVKGTSTELTILGDYEYVGLRSASGAMYLSNITITWESGTPATYSGYCTTLKPTAPTFSPVPNEERIFDSQEVTINCETEGAEIYFQLDGSEDAVKYEAPFTLTATTTVRAWAQIGEMKSDVVEANYIIVPAVASIDEVKYETLGEAFEMAEAGQTVTLLNNTEVTSAITVDKNVKLVLAGNVVENNVGNDFLFTIAEGCSLEIDGDAEGSGMTIPSTNTTAKGFVSHGRHANVTLNVHGGKYSGNMTRDGHNKAYFWAFGDAANLSYTFNNVTTESNIYVLDINSDSENNVLNVTNCTFTDTGEHCVMSVGGINLTATFNGVTVNTEKSLIVEVAGAKATFTNCNFTNPSANETGWMNSALSASYNADVTIESGTYGGTQAVYLLPSSGKITINGGTFTGEVKSSIASNNYGLPYYSGKSELVINGGTFNNCKLTVEDTDQAEGHEATITISGGIFDIPVPAEFCAEGMIPADNTDAATSEAYPYTVAQRPYLAQIGDTQYYSLEDAVAAATGGETITLLADIEDDYTLAEGQTLKLDKNGYSINVVASDGCILDESVEEGVTTYSSFAGIIINNVAELKAFRDAVNNQTSFAGKIVKLNADLDLSGEENWTPIGNLVAYPGESFNGIFDGCGHTISNVTVVDQTPDHAVAGLFGSVVNGTIKNLTVKNVNLTSSHYAAGIVAYTSNGPTIENCHVIGGTITSVPELLNGSYDNGDKIGGIMGYATAGSTINNCTVDGLTLKAYRDMGGIVGYSAGTVTNNTVKNTTIIQSDVNAYKDYEITTYEYIVGRNEGATLENNVSDENNVLTIDGAVAKIGDKLYRQLQKAVDAAEAGATIDIVDDFTLTTVTTSPSNKYNVNIGKSVVINGNNHVITSAEGKRAIVLEGEGLNVTLKDLTIKSNKAEACLWILGNMTCTLDNTVLDGSNGITYNQPLTIGQFETEGRVTLNVTNGSVIKTNDAGTAHYAIIVSHPADITVTDSKLIGWANVYLKPAAEGSTVKIENSEMKSQGLSGNSNNFATITTECNNSTIEVKDTKITSAAVPGTYMSLLTLGGEGNVVKLLGETTYETNSKEWGAITFNWGALFNNKLYLDDTTKEGLAEYFDGSHQETVDPADETGLYSVSFSPEVLYYWAVESGYQGGYYSFAEPFENGWLDNGEFIALQKDITLTKNIACQLGEGTSFNFLLGDYNVTKGDYSVSLNTGVTVLTDKQTDIFKAAKAGYKIVESTTEEGYSYTAQLSAPIIFHDSGEYEDALTMAMAGEGTIKYQLGNGAEQTYTAPIDITANTTIKAWTEQDGATSDVVTREYTIVEKAKGAVVEDGYYTIKTNDDKYVNVAGRKTVTLVSDTKSAGTVIRVKADEDGVKVLRSQAVDLPRYAERAMSYVPELVKEVVKKLAANVDDPIIGEQGADLILDKFNKEFDYHLYLEGENNTYRIYGRTPSMKPVVDFYAENKDLVDSRLPKVEGFVEEILLKVAERLHHPDSEWASKFKIHDIWALIVNEENKLTEPVDEASTAKFFTEVLSSEANIWNFAHETAMIYWDKVKSYLNDNISELGDYGKYIEKIPQIRPNFKYYIVPSASGVDIISEGNEDIINNAARTVWTLTPRTEFDVTFLKDNALSSGRELYTTLYTDFAYELPDGVKAYAITGVNETTGFATKEEISGIIAAQTPVLLQATFDAEQTADQTKTLTLRTEAGTTPETNLLVGADYLINEYEINTPQVESIFTLLAKLSQSLADKYEYLKRKNAGTVNNKYFFGLTEDDLNLCTYKNEKNEDDCVVRSLSMGEKKLGFYNNWTANANEAFLVSETFNPILLTLKGDVYRDGVIDNKDLTALVEIVLGKVTLENKPENYDFDAAHVNEDEDINIADVTALVNILKPQPQD